MPDMAFIEAHLSQDLFRDEGKVNHAYQDHLGYWTIGVGRLIDSRKGGGLSDDEIKYLLANDIRKCINDIQTEPCWIAVQDNVARACAILNMRFQLGPKTFRDFKTSLGYVAAKDWINAGLNMRQSRWYKQTPERAERVIRAIETGV